MINLNSSDEIINIVNDNEMVVLYFSNKVCGACEVIGEKLERILESYPKVKLVGIEGDENIEVAAKYEVFSFPLAILYMNGKETIRVGRNVNFFELEASIKRYYDIMSLDSIGGRQNEQ